VSSVDDLFKDFKKIRETIAASGKSDLSNGEERKVALFLCLTKLGLD
jgi:hypothetical protein